MNFGERLMKVKNEMVNTDKRKGSKREKSFPLLLPTLTETPGRVSEKN
jgi:hypothetical protein